MITKAAGIATQPAKHIGATNLAPLRAKVASLSVKDPDGFFEVLKGLAPSIRNNVLEVTQTMLEAGYTSVTAQIRENGYGGQIPVVAGEIQGQLRDTGRLGPDIGGTSLDEIKEGMKAEAQSLNAVRSQIDSLHLDAPKAVFEQLSSLPRAGRNDSFTTSLYSRESMSNGFQAWAKGRGVTALELGRDEWKHPAIVGVESMKAKAEVASRRALRLQVEALAVEDTGGFFDALVELKSVPNPNAPGYSSGQQNMLEVAKAMLNAGYQSIKLVSDGTPSVRGVLDGYKMRTFDDPKQVA